MKSKGSHQATLKLDSEDAPDAAPSAKPTEASKTDIAEARASRSVSYKPAAEQSHTAKTEEADKASKKSNANKEDKVAKKELYIDLTGIN